MPTRRYAVLLGVTVICIVVAVLVVRRNPRTTILNAPPPEITADIPIPTRPTASLIGATITIPVAPLAAELEASVPKRHGSLDERHDVPSHDRAAIAYELQRGPLAVSFTGGTATLATTIRYTLRAWYDPPLLPELTGACPAGDGVEPRLRLTVRGPVTVGPDWRLLTRSRFSGVVPASDDERDQCRLGFLRIDLTDQVVASARSFLDAHALALDSVAAHVDLRSRFANWWSTLQEPIPLADSLWLVMRPQSVKRGPVRGSGDSIEISLVLSAHPVVIMGPRPSLADVPLPPLDTGEVTPSLEVVMDARAGYPAASGLLQREIGGKEVEGMGRTVRVDSLRIFGIGGGRLALEVLVSGDANARLFFTGTPALEPETGRISIPDLDFDVQTRNMVLATVSWLGADAFREFLRQQARWPGTDVLGWLRDRLAEGLNRDLSDDLRVTGQVDEVRVLGVVATKGSLVVHASATGSAALSVIHKRP